MDKTVVKNYTTTGIGCLPALGLIFIALKLTGHIDWAWVWVLAPFWAGLVALALIILGVGVLVVMGVIIEQRKKRT